MQQVIDITESDIEYAEKILLAEGQNFDDERRASDMAQFTEGQVQLDVNAMPLKKNSAKVVNEKKRKKR